MKFTYNGDSYEIEFQRQRRKKQLAEGQAPSRLTTVRIIRSQPGKLPGEIVAQTSVACSTLDNFVAERGRLAALKLVSKTFSKGFKKVLWDAYINRPRPISKPKGKVVEVGGESGTVSL